MGSINPYRSSVLADGQSDRLDACIQPPEGCVLSQDPVCHEDVKASTEGTTILSSDPLPDQQAIFSFLSKPEAYGIDGAVERINLVDAMLYLAGDHGYKIRRHKPIGHKITLSCEERRILADAEMRFGARHSPELYFGLRPVLQNGDKLQIGPSLSDMASYSPPPDVYIVDWLIEFARFDYHQTFDKVTGLEDLSSSHCADLAAQILTYQQREDSAEGANWLSDLTAHLHSFKEMAQLFSPQPGLRGFADSLEIACQQLDSLKPLLTDRADRGLVQALHGNLKLANFIATSQGPRLINPRLENGRRLQGDCLFDLADFLCHLWSNDKPQKCSWVLSHYCNSIKKHLDLDGLQALGLLIFVSAIDRALALCPTSKSCTSGYRCSLAPAFENFVGTAMQSLASGTPVLALIGGHDHAARQALGFALSPALGRMPGAIYLHHGDEAAKADLSQVLDKAAAALKAGYSIVLDWGEKDTASLEAIQSLAQSADVQILPIWLEDAEVVPRDQASSQWHRLDGSLEEEDLLDEALQLAADYRNPYHFIGEGLDGDPGKIF
ncbi:MAG: hypothetical protein N4A65_13920 [Cohaesibacter sp.]|jgi:aminoglycoside phosphotransferase family enzyme|nr:hypothetical protein [Cohaesibacter sp.]